MSRKKQKNPRKAPSAPKQENIDITDYLRIVMDFLSDAANKPKLPDSEKEKIRKTVFKQLEWIWNKLEGMKKTVVNSNNENLPENIKEIKYASDRMLIKSTECHLEAVDAIAEFLETFNVQLLKDAGSTLEEGASLMGDAKKGYDEIRKTPKTLNLEGWGSEI